MTLAVTAPRRRDVLRIVGGIILAGVAVAIAGYGLCINAWYGAMLGKTAEASTMLAGLSVTADVLALVLPTTATVLWRDARHALAFAAWGLWGVTVTITLMATIGFASLNVADTTAARGKVADENAGLAELSQPAPQRARHHRRAEARGEPRGRLAGRPGPRRGGVAADPRLRGDHALDVRPGLRRGAEPSTSSRRRPAPRPPRRRAPRRRGEARAPASDHCRRSAGGRPPQGSSSGQPSASSTSLRSTCTWPASSA